MLLRFRLVVAYPRGKPLVEHVERPVAARNLCHSCSLLARVRCSRAFVCDALHAVCRPEDEWVWHSCARLAYWFVDALEHYCGRERGAMRAANFSVERMAAGAGRLQIRAPDARRHRSPRRSEEEQAVPSTGRSCA